MAQLYGPPSDGSIIPHELEDAIAADLQDRTTPLGAGTRYGADPLRWQTSRVIDVAQRPRLDDTPVITWAPNVATTLTNPVEYKPSALGTGTTVSDWDGQDDPVFAFMGPAYASGWGANEDQALTGAYKPGPVDNNNRWPIVFSVLTSAVDTIEFAWMGGINISAFIFEINGRQVDDTAVRAPSTLTSTHGTVKLTFPTARARHIRVYAPPAPFFAAARVPTGGTLSKPATTGRTVAIIGDSFAAGSGPSDRYPDQGAGFHEAFPLRLMRALGYQRFLFGGTGGTGWTTTNPFRDRIPPILAANPDTIIFYGSVNDGVDNVALDTAVPETLALIPPEVEVLVIPPHVEAYEGSYARVKAGAIAAGRRVIEPGRVIDGTGKIGAPTGDGNRDFYIMADGAHPTLDGHRALARAFFYAITEERPTT